MDQSQTISPLLGQYVRANRGYEFCASATDRLSTAAGGHRFGSRSRTNPPRLEHSHRRIDRYQSRAGSCPWRGKLRYKTVSKLITHPQATRKARHADRRQVAAQGVAQATARGKAAIPSLEAIHSCGAVRVAVSTPAGPFASRCRSATPSERRDCRQPPPGVRKTPPRSW